MTVTMAITMRRNKNCCMLGYLQSMSPRHAHGRRSPPPQYQVNVLSIATGANFEDLTWFNGATGGLIWSTAGRTSIQSWQPVIKVWNPLATWV